MHAILFNGVGNILPHLIAIDLQGQLVGPTGGLGTHQLHAIAIGHLIEQRAPAGTIGHYCRTFQINNAAGGGEVVGSDQAICTLPLDITIKPQRAAIQADIADTFRAGHVAATDRGIAPRPQVQGRQG
ncbi:hypothetical protein SRDD_38340 [Serratia sp. DD3]|nr:hypothetical protein SRDD_38340 [Serratia sp. DD3]